jgi:phosphogluconate dehydratase
VLRPADEPFAPDGGLKVLGGPLGTAVVKTSAVGPEHRVVTAPAVVFDGQVVHQGSIPKTEDVRRLLGLP